MSSNKRRSTILTPFLTVVVVLTLMVSSMTVVLADNPHTFTTSLGSESFDGPVTMELLQDAVKADVVVTFTALSEGDIPGSAPTGTFFGSQVFSLTADPATTFSRPANITVAYTAGDVSDGAGSYNNVNLYKYDAAFGEWNELSAAVRDIPGSALTAQQLTLGTYALVITGSPPAPPPPAATPVPAPPASVGDWAPASGLLLGLAIAGAMLVLGGGYLFMRRPMDRRA